MNFKCKKCGSKYTYVTKDYRKCRKCGFVQEREMEEEKEEEKDGRY